MANKVRVALVTRTVLYKERFKELEGTAKGEQVYIYEDEWIIRDSQGCWRRANLHGAPVNIPIDAVRLGKLEGKDDNDNQ